MADCTYTHDPRRGDGAGQAGGEAADAERDRLAEQWICPHEAYGDTDRCLFHLSPEERAERDVDDEAVRDAFVEKIHGDGRREKEFVGAHLGTLDLDFQVAEGPTRYPLDLRDATVEELSLTRAWLRHPLRLDGATVGTLTLREAHLIDGLSARGATITGEVNAYEVEFTGDARFDDATFESRANFSEADFDDDVSFAGAVFQAEADFRGAEFHGSSNLLDDNTSFAGATFQAAARFGQAAFEVTDFREVEFRAVADFEQAEFDGAVEFNGATFADEADFDETRFCGDTDFDDAGFAGAAVFRGAEFEGEANVLEDDCTFERVTFEGDANFRNAVFRFVDFADAHFQGHAMFEESQYDRDVTFSGCTFDGEVDFDETRFDGDADFGAVDFRGPAVFRGAEFTGEANHLEDNVTFEGARFHESADFDRASFTTANFEDVSFGGIADFRECTFEDRVDFLATSLDRETYVDMTDAELAEGTIEQPEDEWMRYDLTQATLGDVSLTGPGSDRHLLQYFRFCETDFDGFDFSNHLSSLERNGWVLHEFDENDADFDYAVEMTPDATEVTYLNAKNAASARGNQKAAGEFRVKRQHFARKKDLSMALDDEEDFTLGERVVKLSKVVENYFLGLTCGYGHRLGRVILLFALAPFPFGVLFTFGGPAFKIGGLDQLSSVSELASPGGLQTLYSNVYFAYTSYTTVGYGDFSPVGPGSRFFAISEAFIVVVFSGLVLYALIKRSEQ